MCWTSSTGTFSNGAPYVAQATLASPLRNASGTLYCPEGYFVGVVAFDGQG